MWQADIFSAREARAEKKTDALAGFLSQAFSSVRRYKISLRVSRVSARNAGVNYFSTYREISFLQAGV